MSLDHARRWIEHFFILPLRWFRLHRRNWREGRQRCKVCGCADKLNFSVDDETWKAIIPPRYQNRVVCLACFDDFAKKRDIDYLPTLKAIYFAGDGAAFELTPVRLASPFPK